MATRNFIPLTNIGIDGKQEKRLNFLFGLIAALSGIAAIMIFVDNRRHSKVQEEILDLLIPILNSDPEGWDYKITDRLA